MRKRRNRVSGALGAGILLAVLVACAGGPTTSSTGEYIDDSAITTKVKAGLVADRTVSAYDIKVETFRGTVILSGFVNTEAQKERAITIARSTGGVREVKADGLVLTPRR
jgi:osmotically-inducible protein OsmY